jgi:hypothetical protein
LKTEKIVYEKINGFLKTTIDLGKSC